jgi:hypothetical protein
MQTMVQRQFKIKAQNSVDKKTQRKIQQQYK